MAFTTPDSFNGVSFRTLARGQALTAPIANTVHHIPGGGTNYIDLAGAMPLRITLRLAFNTYAAYQSLEAQRGNQGTLLYTAPGATQRSLVLASLISITQDDGSPKGPTFASAEFLV